MGLGPAGTEVAAAGDRGEHVHRDDVPSLLADPVDDHIFLLPRRRRRAGAKGAAGLCCAVLLVANIYIYIYQDQ